MPAREFAHVKYLTQLVSFLQPITGPSQLIHGDLTGNVLFGDQLRPAIIDFSPYWRPTAFASAIVVADALVWEGADEGILDAVVHVLVTDRLLGLDEPTRPDDADPYIPAVEMACRLAARARRQR